jgi:deoxyribose-phosphate aldolase
VGFPLGASVSRVKAFATEDLVTKGCDEIDMVMNIGQFLSHEYDQVAQEIRAVVSAAQGRIVKVIIETCMLNNEQKQSATRIVLENKAHFVKTSTGFSTSGATVEDVRILKQVVGSGIGIKASGGIRTHAQAIALLQAGATRLGTSAGPAIMQKTINTD